MEAEKNVIQKLKRLEALEKALSLLPSNTEDWISLSQLQTITTEAYASHFNHIISDQIKLDDPKQVQYALIKLTKFFEELRKLQE